jgi:hypothetical protein
MSLTYSETLSDYSLVAELRDSLIKIQDGIARAIYNQEDPEVIAVEQERAALLEDDIARIDATGTDWLSY